MTSVRMSAISGRASRKGNASMRSSDVVTAWAKIVMRSPQPAPFRMSSAR